MQRDPVRQIIEHIDLLVVKQGEKISVEIPVTVTGESFPGTIVNLETTTLKLEVSATEIPEHIEVSVEGLQDGTVITAGEIALPAGAVLADDESLQIVGILTPRGTAEDDAADAAAAAE